MLILQGRRIALTARLDRERGSLHKETAAVAEVDHETRATRDWDSSPGE